MFNDFNNFFDDIFDYFMSPAYVTTCVSGGDFPNTKEVVNATVESPLAFNLITDSDKEITLELGMAGVKKENLKISKKGRTYTIVCLGTKSDVDEKKVAVLRKGLKVPSTDDITSTFVVPETFDIEKSKIKYEDGLLTINVPLKETEKSTEVKF